MTGLEIVASAITKAVMTRALAGTPVGKFVRPAFRIYSAFDLAGALADCADLDVYDERVDEEEFCGVPAESLASKIGSEVISVSLNKGFAQIYAPKLQVAEYTFRHNLSWPASREEWLRKRQNFTLERRWDPISKTWKRP